MNYQDYLNKRREEFEALPIWFAFGQRQFDEAMIEHGLQPTDTDKIYRLSDTGGFYKREDAAIIKAFFDSGSYLETLMGDGAFREDAFYYEMGNHEYAINWQGDWDVCSCFGGCEWSEEKTYVEYLQELGHPEWVPQYRKAKKRHMRYAIENEWV